MVFSIRKDDTFNQRLQHNLTERFTSNRRTMNEAVHVSDLTSV
jgi:ASC-1-like (ASCH) protein